MPRGRLPRPDTPVPPRFLPDYDNALLGHADRTRIFNVKGQASPRIGKSTFLVDGFVHGTWTIVRQKTKATLTLTPFERLSKKDVSGLTGEGTHLLTSAAPEAAAHDARVAAVSK